MSVTIMLRFSVPDIARAKQALAANADLLQEVTEDARRAGALHHQFLESDGSLIVIDEWDSPDSFQRFFQGNDKIQKVTSAAGVRDVSTPQFMTPLQAPGSF